MKNNSLNLRIKPHFTIISHSSNQVELRKGVWNPVSFTLSDESGKGKLYHILRDLDGRYSVSDISVKYDVSRADIEGVLDQLQQLGVIEGSPSTMLDHYIDQTCPLAMKQIYSGEMKSTKKILLIGDDSVSHAVKEMLQKYFSLSVIETLDPASQQYQILIDANDDWLYDTHEKHNVIQLFSDWKDYFVICAQQVINPVICSRVNVITHALQTAWLHGALDGPFLLIGPLFSAFNGPCYHCFESRVSMNLREHASYVKYKNAITENKIYENSDTPLHFPLVNLLASHLTLEALNYLATETGFTRNKVLSIYLPTMEIIFNEILKISNCPVCGIAENRDSQQLYFDYQSLFASANL